MSPTSKEHKESKIEVTKAKADFQRIGGEISKFEERNW